MKADDRHQQAKSTVEPPERTDHREFSVAVIYSSLFVFYSRYFALIKGSIDT